MKFFQNLFFDNEETVPKSTNVIAFKIGKSLLDYEKYDKTCDTITKTVPIGRITSQMIPEYHGVGSFVIVINSDYRNGPNAVFSISRGEFEVPGVVGILSSSPGKNGENLSLICKANEYPCILMENLNIHKYNLASVLITVKII